MVLGTRIIKRKINGFFKSDDLPIIRQVVNDVHLVMCNASILVRAFYLSQYENKDNAVLHVDRDLVSVACDVVQGKMKTTRDNTWRVNAKLEKMEKKASEAGEEFDKDAEKVKLQSTKTKHVNKKTVLYEQMSKLYQEMFAEINEEERYIKSAFSLSHILSYSIEQLLTAYKNNVVLHFTKYPIRVIKCDLMSIGLKRKDAIRVARKVVAHVFYESEHAFNDEDNQKFIELFNKQGDIVGDLKSKYVGLFPEKKTDDKPRSYEITNNQWIYLNKMVELNRILETNFLTLDEKHRKLLNPLPFHSSFIPMHIRLDTSGLVQLLSTKERLNDFKRLYSIEHNVNLRINNKSDVLSSFEKIFDRKPHSKVEEGLFATSFWSYFTNLKECKQWKELETENIKNKKNRPVIKDKKPFKYEDFMFNNSIVTDGTSLSFQICHKSLFGRKDYVESQQKKKKPKKTDDKEEPVYEIEELTDQFKDKKKTATDPGKRDLLSITDGFRTICYTKGQRNQDTLLETRSNETLKKRRKKDIERIETTILGQFCSKSCSFSIFVDYALARKRHERTLAQFYQAPMFRQFKFLVFTKQRSSEDKFANKVQKTFSTKYEGEPKTCVTDEMIQNNDVVVNSREDLVIVWGNWGKTSHPNRLKGCQPSQGIGLIRSFLRFFMIYIISEYLTSQTCPCCKQQRCMENPRLNGFARHHLLRCSNDNCPSRWWNRNVLGSFNILEKVEQCTLVKKLRGSDLAVQYLE